MSEDRNLKKPREGITTLSVLFTKSLMTKMVKACRDLRGSGASEGRILDKMRVELKHVDAHTLRRIYDKSLDREIPDDITPGMVKERQETKRGAIELELESAPEALVVGSIVQYEGVDWCVTLCRGSTLRLRQLR